MICFYIDHVNECRLVTRFRDIYEIDTVASNP